MHISTLQKIEGSQSLFACFVFVTETPLSSVHLAVSKATFQYSHVCKKTKTFQHSHERLN